MKKKLIWLVTLIIYLFSVTFTQTLAAEEIQVDQKNLVISQGYVVIGASGWNQTFTPTFDNITSVSAYLDNMTIGENVSMRLSRVSDGFSIAAITSAMIDDSGWMKFEKIGTTYDLTPGIQYAIHLMTDAIDVRWIKSGGDTYAGGTRRQMDTEWAGDFPFYTMGYTIVEDPPVDDPPVDDPPAEDPPAEDPPAEDPPAENSDSEDSTVNTDNENIITLTQSSDEAEKEENENIENPAIEKVVKNDIEVSEFLEGITVKQSDKLVVSGTSVDVDKVVLIIGNTAFSVIPDDDGSWTMNIDLEQLKIGEYTIKIQGQKDEEGSSIEEVFDIEITTSNGVSDEDSKEYAPTFYYELISGKYRPFTVALLSLLYLILMIILFFFPLKKKEKKEEKKSPKKRK